MPPCAQTDSRPNFPWRRASSFASVVVIRAPGPRLRLLQRLRQVQDRLHTGVGRGQLADPVVAVPAGKLPGYGLEGLLPLRARLPLAGDPLRKAEGPAEGFPKLWLQSPHRQMAAIAAPEHVVASVRARELAGQGPPREQTGGGDGHQGEDALQQGDVHDLAAARARAGLQRGQDRDRSQKTARHVR